MTSPGKSAQAHVNKTAPHSMTTENVDVSRNDIQNLIDVRTPVADLATILVNRGMTDDEVKKVLSDLSSYH